MTPRSRLRLVGSLAIAIAIAGCGEPTTALRHLDPHQPWFADNRERIDALLDEHTGDGEAPPVAVLDWDNTVIKNDVGDITLFYMLRTGRVLQPPAGDWLVTSPFLTRAAQDALGVACGPLARPGEALPTGQPEGLACTDEILAIYGDATTRAGEPAFADWNHRTMEPAYAWAVQLQAGYTPAEVRTFADAAITEALSAAIAAVQTIGSTADANAYLRVYEPMRDLIETLQTDGFDVWVLSASAQPVVETFAARVGIAADHVIGVRAVVDGDGKLSADLQGCGGAPDGANTMITYLEGKRCWMNQIIFGITGDAATATQTAPSLRPVFAAGDSDTDVAFLQDASGLKLVLNRNKPELMCNAYHNVGGNWLINPMFIAPRDQALDGYACTTDACTDAAGVDVACRDERGGPIPDQQDSVFCADGTVCQR